MGKGDTYRPFDQKKYAAGYDRVFNNAPIEEVSGVTEQPKEESPVPFDEADLTKMDHPTACKYLVVGMKVKVVRRAEYRERKWLNSWLREMDDSIGECLIVMDIHCADGIRLSNTGFRYPAFCLQIIKQENNNEGR